MSFVVATTDVLGAAAGQVVGIGAVLEEVNAAAVSVTTSLQAAAGW
ncbi:PE domain-containing protein [Mycobacterium sp.]